MSQALQTGDVQTTRAQYTILSAVLLIGVVASLPGAYLFYGIEIPAMKAIGILLIPFALFCWIFTTIRAIHLYDERYWTLSSTWVIFLVMMAAFVFVSVASLFVGDKNNNGMLTLYFVGLFAYLGALGWSVWYNGKRLPLLLVLSLTLLQTMVAVAAVLWLANLMGKREPEQEE